MGKVDRLPGTSLVAGCTLAGKQGVVPVLGCLVAGYAGLAYAAVVETRALPGGSRVTAAASLSHPLVSLVLGRFVARPAG